MNVVLIGLAGLLLLGPVLAGIFLAARLSRRQASDLAPDLAPDPAPGPRP